MTIFLPFFFFFFSYCFFPCLHPAAPVLELAVKAAPSLPCLPACPLGLRDFPGPSTICWPLPRAPVSGGVGETPYSSRLQHCLQPDGHRSSTAERQVGFALHAFIRSGPRPPSRFAQAASKSMTASRGFAAAV